MANHGDDDDLTEMWNAVAPEDNKRKRSTDDEEQKVIVNKGFFRRKKQTPETNPEQIALTVESVMARLELAAEDDADLNRNGLPALNKLKTLPLLMNALSKKQFHQGFLNHGILDLLRKWLEPLPDGSLPNLAVRSAVLDVLTNHLPINLQSPVRKEQFKRSGLGKVIMFLSKSEEEKLENRKLAKELVFRWSRGIYDKSTDYEDLTRSYPLSRNKSSTAGNRKLQASSAAGSYDQDIDFGLKSGSSDSSGQGVRVLIPERVSMDYVVRPESNLGEREHAAAESVKKERIRKNIEKMKERRKKLKAPGIRLSIQDRCEWLKD